MHPTKGVLVSLLLLQLILSSCSSNAASVAAGEAIKVPAGQGAQIRVFRANNAPAAAAARIYLDDAFLGYVPTKSQAAFDVRPGTYHLKTAYPAGLAILPKGSKPFSIRKGETVNFGIGMSQAGELVSLDGLSQLSKEDAAKADAKYPSRE